MKRLYMLTPYDLMTDGTVQVGTSFDQNGNPTPVMSPLSSLFSGIGAHGIYYEGPDSAQYEDMALLIVEFDSDSSMDMFHAVNGVAILPNPGYDAAKTLANHVNDTDYKFTQDHLNCLLSWTGLNCLATDTVIDLCNKAKALNPIFDLGLSTL